MTILIKVLIGIILMVIAYQDFRYRKVVWYLFPILLIFLLYVSFYETDLSTLALNSFINISFLLILLLVLTVLFSLKNGHLINISNEYLGLGDIIFLGVLTVFLSPINYSLFFTGSLFLTIALVLINTRLKNNIPLAGLQSIMLMVVLLSSSVYEFSLQNDTWLLQLLF